MTASLSLIPLVVSIAVFRRLSRSEELAASHPEWQPMFAKGIYAAILFVVIELIFHITPVTMWLWHIFILLLMGMVMTNKDFQDARPIVVAALPVEILSFIVDLFSRLFPITYKKVDDYADAAIFFALLWAGAMWLYARNRQKAVNREKLKRRQEEQMYRITEAQKAALEITVTERTAELTQQKEELQKSLAELRSMQAQLIQSEKMASLGELTAGIAHEIQNPLNFVNNFSEVSAELLVEMEEEMQNGNEGEVKQIAEDVRQNLQKIILHGKRADAIVKGMLQHSRMSSGQKEFSDINALADEYLRLSYHGLRAKDKSFNASLKMAFDPGIEKISIIPQDLGRVLLNLYNNAFYAVAKKQQSHPQQAGGEKYEPTVSVSTKRIRSVFGTTSIEIRVRDNGDGIPKNIVDKIFQPFFTTKPTGEGTGLGLSLSYDIITKSHAGTLEVNSVEGEWTEFVINIPAVGE